MRQRRYFQSLTNSTHSSMQVEYKMKSWQKSMWSERWRGENFRGTNSQGCSNSLFHSIWFHIPWWRRLDDGAPARRAGCCAAAPSPWWLHWPGMELLRQEHVNKQRANHLCTNMHTASHKISCTESSGGRHSRGPQQLMNIHRDASKCLRLMIKISITVQTVEDSVTPASGKLWHVDHEWQYSSINSSISSRTSWRSVSLMTELFTREKCVPATFWHQSYAHTLAQAPGMTNFKSYQVSGCQD